VKVLSVGCAGAFALSACMTNAYEVSHGELLRLARTPPAQRGERLRVLQQTSLRSDDLQEGEDEQRASGTGLSANVNVSGGSGSARPAGAPAHAAWSASHGGGGGGISLGGGGGNGAIVEAIVAVVIASGVGVALATTEGRRFDGWARVRGDAGIYLITAGDTEWIPLSELTEAEVAGAEHGVLIDRHGSVQRLARAPLDRIGVGYEVELGSAALDTVDRATQFGFACRTGVGYFPARDLGILFADQVAFAEADARLERGAIFNGRVGVEVEYFAARVGRFHAGIYGELGGALVLQDLPDRTHSWSGPYAAAGFLAQIDWTTRLALDLRAGIAALPAHPATSLADRAYLPELTIGLAVY